MGIIFTPTHMTWQRQQCVLTHSLIMRYHTGKCVLRHCAQCPSINIPDQETYNNHPNPSPSIHCYTYHLISRFTNMAGFRYATRKFAESVNRILLQYNQQR